MLGVVFFSQIAIIELSASGKNFLGIWEKHCCHELKFIKIIYV